MKKFVALLASCIGLAGAFSITGAVVIPAIALATQTVGISGFNCSVTAYTPTRYINGASYLGGVSCGGSQSNYSKRIYVEAVQLVSGGWSELDATGWTGWTTANPLQTGFSEGPCVSGRWYATIVSGEINHAPLDSSGTASSEGSGWQCP